MKRHDLVNRLLRIRAAKLKAALADLRGRVAELSGVDRARKQVLEAAREAIRSAPALFDLGPLGEARLASQKIEKALKKEIADSSQRADRARRLRDSAQVAADQIRDQKRASRERMHELDAEQFFTWRSTMGPRR